MTESGASLGVWSVLPLLGLVFPLLFFFFVGLRERLRPGSAVWFLIGFVLVFAGSLLRVVGQLTELKDALILGANDPVHDFLVAAGEILGLTALLGGSFREIRIRRREAEEGNFREAVLDSLEQGVVVADENNRVTFVNRAAERLLGSSSEQVLGQQLESLLPAERKDIQVMVNLSSDEAGGQPQSEHHLIRIDENRILDVTIQPLQAAAGVQANVQSMQDITPFVRAGELAGELISTVSHEMRTPLTTIRGYLELLLEEESNSLSPDVREHLALVLSRTERLENLVSNFLDLSRLEAGILTLRKEPFVFTRVVDEVVTNMLDSFQEKRLSLDISVPERPPWVMGDADRLSQVLSNLLSNALKYTPEGGSVRVQVEREGDHLRVDVSDTGIGISEEDQKQLFKKFFRSSDAAQQQIEGSGLGLAISKSIVELHGGKIWCSSYPGVGSTFSFTVPIPGITAAGGGGAGEPSAEEGAPPAG